jgi:hypothetical protein
VADNWQLSIPPINQAVFNFSPGASVIEATSDTVIDGAIKLVHRGITEFAESGSALAIDEPWILAYPACINPQDLHLLGLKYPEDVIEGVLRIPVFALTLYVATHSGAAPDQTHLAIPDGDVAGLAAIWADILLNAQNCRDLDEFVEFVLYRIEEAGRIVDNAIVFESCLDSVASDRIEGQRWVVDGVADTALRGARRVRVFLESLGVEYQVRALTGEQRHDLLARYRNGEDLRSIQKRTLLWCVRDPFEPREPAFPCADVLDQLLLVTLDDLFIAVLWVSGLLALPNAPMPELTRGGEVHGDLSFLLRAVHLSSSDGDVRQQRENIAAHFLWKQEKDWRAAEGSVFGLVGKSIKREWLKLAERGVLAGDPTPQTDLVFLGAANDKRIEYFAGREQFPAKGKLRPDSADYDGDSESRHSYAGWEIDYSNGLQAIDVGDVPVEIDTDLLGRGTIEPSPLGHNYFDCWVLNPADSLSGDFQNWVDIEVDVRRAVDAVCVNRSEELAKRDTEVFMWRYIAGKGRNVISVLSGLPENVVENSWRSLEPDRNGGRILAWLRDHGYHHHLDTGTWAERKALEQTREAMKEVERFVVAIASVWWTTAPDQQIGPRIARIDFRPFGNPRLPTAFKLIAGDTEWSRACRPRQGEAPVDSAG